MQRHAPHDVTGARIRVGAVVRIVGVPDLANMNPTSRRQSRPVFSYLVGKYKRVVGFDDLGNAEISFHIEKGRHRGLHTVWLEPCHLRVRRSRRSSRGTRRGGT